MLSLVTSSTDEQLTTTGAVKLLLGLSGSSDDDLINGIINRASRWAETRLGRGPLTAQSYRETLSGYGGRRMQLSRYPVRAVTSLWGATDTGQATTFLSSAFKVDHAAGILVRDAGWAWNVPRVPRPFVEPLADSFYAGEEYEPWLGDYIAGWTYDGVSTDSANYSTVHGTTSTGRTLPDDIEEAVRYRAAQIYDGSQGIKSKRVGDLAITYATFSDGRIQDAAEELLESYRSVV